MDIDLIRTFIQVARTRHFRKAAEQLFLTQSAVSARIKQLEERLGARLFERSKHQVALTAAGSRFLIRAESMMAEWFAATQEARHPEDARQSLVIGATDTLWQIFLTDWMIEICQHSPDLYVHAELHTNDSLMPALLDSSIDVAIRFDAPNLPRLLTRELAVIDLIMVSNQPHPDVATALKSGFIDIAWGEAFAIAMQQYLGDAPAAKAHTSVGKVALELVLRSGGTAFLPRQMVQHALLQQQLFCIPNSPVIQRTVHAVVLHGREAEPQLATALDSMATGLLTRA